MQLKVLRTVNTTNKEDSINTIVAHNHTSFQVFILTTPSKGAYWERFYQNHIGWHKDFDDVLTYTFENVSTSLAHIIQSVKSLPGEENGSSNNLQLVAFGLAWAHNPNADWYLYADDDTIIFADNLKEMVKGYDPNTLIMKGKCVHFDTSKFGRIHFVVGGAGILMSRALVKELVHRMSVCRTKFLSVYHSDARVGACVEHTLNRTLNLCKHDGYDFSNEKKHERQKFLVGSGSNRPISIHVKDAAMIKYINKARAEMISFGVTITWKSLESYMTRRVHKTLAPGREPWHGKSIGNVVGSKVWVNDDDCFQFAQLKKALFYEYQVLSGTCYVYDDEYINVTCQFHCFKINMEDYFSMKKCCLPENPRCGTPEAEISACEQHNIMILLDVIRQTGVPYFLMYDTLLGAIREKDHMKTVANAAVAVNAADWLKMASHIQLGIKSSSHYLANDSFPARLYFSAVNSLHVDIWLFEHGKNTTQVQYRFSTYLFLSTEDIFPLRKCYYGFTYYLCPVNADAVLQKIYGKEWRHHKGGTKNQTAGEDNMADISHETTALVCKRNSTLAGTTLWGYFESFIEVLNSLEAPWSLYAGSLLYWYRDCTIPHDDIDVQLDLNWMSKNVERLESKLNKAGFFAKFFFGKRHHIGYEVAYFKDGVRFDIFSVYRTKDKLDITGLTIGATTYPCTLRKKYIEKHTWNGIMINVPAPVESVISQTYNINWNIKTNNYSWSLSPFIDGFCNRTKIL